MRGKTLATVGDLRRRGHASLKRRWGGAILAFLVLVVFALSYVPALSVFTLWDIYETEFSGSVFAPEIQPLNVEEFFMAMAGLVWLFSLFMAVILILAGPAVVFIGGPVRVWYAGVCLRRLQTSPQPKRSFGETIGIYFKSVGLSLALHCFDVGMMLILFCGGTILIGMIGTAVNMEIVTTVLSIIYLALFLFIVGGVIWGHSVFSMVPYMLADGRNTDSSKWKRTSGQYQRRWIYNRGIDKRQKEFFKQFEWRAFCLRMSYLGGYLLSVLTLGLGFLIIMPRLHASQAALYLDWKAHSEEKSFFAKLFHIA